MEAYGHLLLIAMPAFLLLVLMEKAYAYYRGADNVPALDMISSFTSGITNVTKDVLGLTVVVVSYGWLLDKLALTQMEAGFTTGLIVFIVQDFASYWIHRLAHRVNVFWNNHIIHHSSEQFNLACALRQSIAVFFRIFTFFLIPAALLGIPQSVVAVVIPLHLFAQFWYHTEHIHKMGLLEHILVTPAHHRVHHAINPQYMDKNYSAIFIVWDKLFGTFQEERDDIKPVYGVTRAVRTWNPIRINFKHLALLIHDCWHTASWKDKCRIWFMPTGWRPADVEARWPVHTIQDVVHQQKYTTEIPRLFLGWCWFQLIVLLLLISFLFARLSSIGTPLIYGYGLFIFLFVYALTELMDRNRWSFLYEILKLVSLYWVIQSFLTIMPGQELIIGMIATGYVLLSITGTLFFLPQKKGKKKPSEEGFQ